MLLEVATMIDAPAVSGDEARSAEDGKARAD
jgi:hypothetical protein